MFYRSSLRNIVLKIIRSRYCGNTSEITSTLPFLVWTSIYILIMHNKFDTTVLFNKEKHIPWDSLPLYSFIHSAIFTRIFSGTLGCFMYNYRIFSYTKLKKNKTQNMLDSYQIPCLNKDEINSWDPVCQSYETYHHLNKTYLTVWSDEVSVRL